MRALRICLLAGLLAIAVQVPAEAATRQELVQFRQGATEAALKGRIKGRETIDYRVRARQGQMLSVTFKPGNRSAYFNVLPPAADEALFVGSSSGDRFEGRLPFDGLYTIRVYLMRSAARRNEHADYTLTVGIKDSEAVSRQAFERKLELLGIRFLVTCENSGSINRVRIVPAGLEIDNTPVERTIDGTVTGVEAADLNADGSPEIYVYVTSAGSGSYGSLVAYSANRRKSLSEIYLPPLADEKRVAEGYRGHDEFTVLEGVLGRRFPVYRDGDINAGPTGGMRQLHYKLVPGEAGWFLKLDRTDEF